MPCIPHRILILQSQIRLCLLEKAGCRHNEVTSSYKLASSHPRLDGFHRHIQGHTISPAPSLQPALVFSCKLWHRSSNDCSILITVTVARFSLLRRPSGPRNQQFLAEVLSLMRASLIKNRVMLEGLRVVDC